MNETLIKKILARHVSGLRNADFAYTKVDFMFSNDITGPLAIKKFTESGFAKVKDPSKVCFICEHFTPARDKKRKDFERFLQTFWYKEFF